MTATRTTLLLALAAAVPASADEKLPDGATVVRIEAMPEAVALADRFDYRQLLLTAHLADGNRADVTRIAEVEIPADLATITENGLIRPKADGAGSIRVSVAGQELAIPITVSGQGSLILTAPTDGPYQGITFFQERSSNVTGNIQGTGNDTNITGTFYFPGALLNVSGNGGVVNLGSQYISRLLNLSGNGGIHVNWDPEYVARKRSIYIVE